MEAIYPIRLLVNHRVRYGAGVIEGVLRYCDQHAHRLVPSIVDYGQAEVLRMNWPASGLIAQIASPTMAEAIAATGLPAVNVSTTLEDNRWPVVGCDDAAVGELAAQHLLDQHPRAFASLGWTGKAFSRLRCGGFAAQIRRAGQVHHHHDVPADVSQGGPHLQAVAAWLTTLPRPVGVFACNDPRAMDLLMACNRAGLSVPEEVLIMGVGNHDEVSWTTPPLTSVEPDLEGIGYHAAAMLHRLLARRKRRRPSSILLRPLQVVARASTDRSTQRDVVMARARAWIDRHALSGEGVAEMVQALGLPRRTLENRFRRTLGRTPLQELHRARCEHAKRLLLTTSDDLDAVAGQSGFRSPQRLICAFRRHTGMTPGAFRRGTQVPDVGPPR